MLNLVLPEVDVEVERKGDDGDHIITFGRVIRLCGHLDINLSQMQNPFDNLKKYIFDFEQIHFEILNKYIL